MSPNVEQLTAINLRYGTSSKSLKVLAFSNLIAKAIYTSEEALTKNEIAKSVANILDIRSVDIRLVEEGLYELKEGGDIYETKKGKWKLTKDTSDKVKKEIEKNSRLINGVVLRNFSKKIKHADLVYWFNLAAADFFGYNGEEWVKSVCADSTKIPNVKTMDELLKQSIEACGLGEYEDELVNGFQGFLASTNKEDQRALMHFGFAMFSAKLVVSDIGADPIILENLRDAVFLVDTNFIFPLQLEGHRFSESFESLGQALKEINAEIVYINETKEEHSRVLAGRKGSVLKLIKEYPLEVTTDAADPFVATAKIRGCKEDSDFDRFFDELKILPQNIPSGPNISLIDDLSIESIVKNAKNDSELKESIQKWRLKLRPHWDKRPKSETALNHDSSLIHVQDSESKKRKVYILTLDRSLQICASRRAGKHSLPPVVYLEGLIQILAANNGGPNVDVTNYAPLLSAILLKRCAPPENTYTLEDLHWLINIQKNVAKFTPTKIKEIALEVAKARLSGKKADDRGLRRMVDRFYQAGISEVGKDLKDAEERARQAILEADKERSIREDKEKKISFYENKEAKRTLTKNLILQLLWRLPITIAISVVVYYVISSLLETINQQESNNLFNFVNIASFVLPLLGFGWKLCFKPIQNYFRKKKDIL